MSTFEVTFNTSVSDSEGSVYSGYYFRLLAKDCFEVYSLALDKLKAKLDLNDCRIYSFKCEEVI